MSIKPYNKQALAALLNDDWHRLGDWHEVRDDGVWVAPIAEGERGWDRDFLSIGLKPGATAEQIRAAKGRLENWSATNRAIRLAHPKNDLDQPALPFPFTATEFVAFCASAPIFDWECIESVYSNDDDSLDEDAIAKLAQWSPMAAQLVRAQLSGNRMSTDFATPIARREKATARDDRVLLEMLAEKGIDPTRVPREKGGSRASLKSQVLALVSTPKYVAQGVTWATIKKAWERLPKIDPPTNDPPMKHRK